MKPHGLLTLLLVAFGMAWLTRWLLNWTAQALDDMPDEPKYNPVIVTLGLALVVTFLTGATVIGTCAVQILIQLWR